MDSNSAHVESDASKRIVTNIAANIATNIATNIDRSKKAQQLVNKYSFGTAGLALVPVPFLDLALVAGAQLNMLRQLAGFYGLPFSAQLGKSAIATLIAGSLPSTSFSLFKLIPGWGIWLGSLSYPAAAGAATYALGMVFIAHFESGGTLLDFDPAKVKKYYQQQFEQRQATPFGHSADESESGADSDSHAEPEADSGAVRAPVQIVVSSTRDFAHSKGAQPDGLGEPDENGLPVSISGWQLR